MSYNFQINKKNPLTYKNILDLIDFHTDEITYYPLVDRNTDLNPSSVFFLPTYSTRGVNLKDKGNTYSVEMNTGCSGEDYFLATRLALSLATLNDSEIETDQGHYTIENFSSHFNLQWAQENKILNIETLKSLVEQHPDSSAILNGYKVPYYFGIETLKEYSKDNPSIDLLADRIIAGIKRNQHLESEFVNLEFPTKMEMENDDRSMKEWTFFLIQIGFPQLIQPVDFIILRHENDFAKIPYEDFIKETANLLTPIDEKQLVIQVIPEDLYVNLIKKFTLEKAEKEESTKESNEIQSPPKPQPIKPTPTQPKNKWWKFW